VIQKFLKEMYLDTLKVTWKPINKILKGEEDKDISEKLLEIAIKKIPPQQSIKSKVKDAALICIF